MAAKPRIGINSVYRREEREKSVLASAYYDAVAAAGGVPLILPPLAADAAVSDAITGLDGVVLSGGRDYESGDYGPSPDGTIRPVHPRREAFDLALARAVISRRLPCLGICAGAQAIAIASGGDLIADIRRGHPGAIAHEERAGRPVFHDVEVTPGSRLERAVGAGRIRVNSLHHQAVRSPGEGLRVAAVSPDGIVEALEGDGSFILGVQWHPEMLADDEAHRRIFEALIAACRER